MIHINKYLHLFYKIINCTEITYDIWNFAVFRKIHFGNVGNTIKVKTRITYIIDEV